MASPSRLSTLAWVFHHARCDKRLHAKVRRIMQGFLIGSEAHKQLLCRTFMESHEAYEPTNLPWPALDEQSLRKLRSLPFWRMALQAETNAGAMVSGFAATIADPTIR